MTWAILKRHIFCDAVVPDSVARTTYKESMFSQHQGIAPRQSVVISPWRRAVCYCNRAAQPRPDCLLIIQSIIVWIMLLAVVEPPWLRQCIGVSLSLNDWAFVRGGLNNLT